MIKRKLENYHFPEGVKSMFINGRYYSRKKFLEARSKELRAKKNSYEIIKGGLQRHYNLPYK